MLAFLCTLWVILAALDAGHTVWILSKHGVEIEMNGAIRKLCAWFGVARGSIIGIFIPTCAIAGLCWMFQLKTLMLVFVLLRVVLASLQIRYHFSNAH